MSTEKTLARTLVQYSSDFYAQESAKKALEGTTLIRRWGHIINVTASMEGWYHVDFKMWDFGKLSAVREIALAKERGYRYHYMGFFVESCPKMRYKANFRPSHLLDPLSYDWDLLNEDLRQRLATRKFASMRLERLLGAPSTTHDLELWLRDPIKVQVLEQEIEIGNVKYKKALTYIKNSSHDLDYDSATESAFSAGMPGLLPLAEVEGVGQWRLRLRNFVVVLEDLRGWAEYNAADPSNVRGVAVELAASIGLDLVEKTKLSFTV